MRWLYPLELYQLGKEGKKSKMRAALALLPVVGAYVAPQVATKRAVLQAVSNFMA